jgi:hypothetical protein
MACLLNIMQKMKTQIILGIAALTLGLVAVKSFTPVKAYQGDPTKRGPNCTEEQHQEMLSLLKNKDYQAWVGRMNGKGVTRFVNQDNFAEFADARLAAENGDSSKLNAFRAKYGMGQGQGKGMGMHRNWQ